MENSPLRSTCLPSALISEVTTHCHSVARHTWGEGRDNLVPHNIINGKYTPEGAECRGPSGITHEDETLITQCSNSRRLTTVPTQAHSNGPASEASSHCDGGVRILSRNILLNQARGNCSWGGRPSGRIQTLLLRHSCLPGGRLRLTHPVPLPEAGVQGFGNKHEDVSGSLSQTIYSSQTPKSVTKGQLGITTRQVKEQVFRSIQKGSTR